MSTNIVVQKRSRMKFFQFYTPGNPFEIVAAAKQGAVVGAATGFDERRSDPSGVFVFRKGNPDVVYTFNLKRPEIMSLIQRFPIEGEDIVYVTEAPLARWNRLITQVLPVSVSQAANSASRFTGQ